MTINAGSSNPLDHSEDRRTDTSLGSGKAVKTKKKHFWNRFFARLA